MGADSCFSRSMIIEASSCILFHYQSYEEFVVLPVIVGFSIVGCLEGLFVLQDFFALWS